MTTKQHILILDGETKAALACARSLGQAGYKITIAAHTKKPIAAASKYCSQFYPCPNPMRDRDTYIKWIFEVVSTISPDMLLPVTDVSLGLCLSIENTLRKITKLPFCSNAQFQMISNKAELMIIASKAGIFTPKTCIIDLEGGTLKSSEEAIKSFNYPAVLKPNFTVSDAKSHFIKLPVIYPNNAEDVFNYINKITNAQRKPITLLLQEKISGSGVGLFTLFSNGHPLVYFAHRRLLEKPPSGGRSVLSESTSLDLLPLKESETLLHTLNFHGACMLEFKLSDNGHYYLMEINPRFWGSLQLAIDAGVNFPLLLTKLTLDGEEAVHESLRNTPPFEIGKRLRCFFGTIDHVFIKIKSDPLRSIRDILFDNSLQIMCRPSNTFNETLRPIDPWPFFREMRNYMANIITHSED